LTILEDSKDICLTWLPRSEGVFQYLQSFRFIIAARQEDIGMTFGQLASGYLRKKECGNAARDSVGAFERDVLAARTRPMHWVDL
jgi:hypothetical protein